MSFEATFLGHQGWLFTSGETRLLVDPLLTASIGHGGSVGSVYPPRVFSFAELPPVDAVFLSHEHEDHFDLPSLARIDREVPILLSARSSGAARAILAELGFSVRPVGPGDSVKIGDLELLLFAPDLDESGDEWDVLPFLVRDRAGHGSLFTSIDVQPRERVLAAVRRVIEKPQLWCHTNNAIDWSITQAGRVIAEEPPDSNMVLRAMLADYAKVRATWAAPEAVLVCGGGVSFEGERAHLNRNVFRADSEAVAKACAAIEPQVRFVASLPGRTVSMANGVVTGVREESAFLRAPSRSEWPPRDYLGDVELLEEYAPFTEKRELTREELDELGRELAAYAAHMCGSAIFRALHSLDETELAGRRPTISLVLLCDDEGGSYVYEYDPSAVAFVRARGEDPVGDYVGGMECWASDLLALFRGEISASAVAFGRGRTWNALPERVTLRWEQLWGYCHPLRRPDRFLSLYRKLLAASADAPVCVRAAGRVTITAEARRA